MSAGPARRRPRLFVDGLGVGRVWAYLASIPPVTVALFLANRVWTFSERR